MLRSPSDLDVSLRWTLDLDLEISINKNGTPVIEIQRSRGGINMPMETKKGDDQAVCGVHGWKRGAGSQRRAENLTSKTKKKKKKKKKKRGKKKWRTRERYSFGCRKEESYSHS
jgi:hypothetical protein